MQKRAGGLQGLLTPALRIVRGEPLIALVAIFLASRYALRLSGLTFDMRPLDTSWQIIDPVLLRHDLARSLFYMHGQPPLYNLFLGLALKLAPSAAGAAWLLSAAYMAMGLLLVIVLYRLLRGLGVAAWPSVAVATLFLLSPATILYENIPYYTCPAALLLCLCALLFQRMVTAFTPGRALALFLCMTALIYTRSLFQIPWFAALVLFCLWALPGHRRQILVTAALPLVLIALLYAKNGLIIGQPSTSSWLGMSLAKLTTMRLSQTQRRAMIDAGELSPLARVPPYSVPEAYRAYEPSVPATGIPILDQKRKSTAHINFNYRIYPIVSRQYLDDALTVVKKRPLTYLDAVGSAWLMFLRPSSDYPFLQDNRAQIAPLVRFFNRYVGGQPVYTRTPGFDFHGAGSIAYLVAAGFVLCVVWGGALGVRALTRRHACKADLTLLFLWLNVLYVSVIGNAFEIGENQRFRFLINAFLSIMLAVLACRACRHAARTVGAIRAARDR